LSQIKTKIAKLNQTKVNLKKKFIGIDRQIDQIVNSIKAFILFPETLNKPLIINLWGITGTFKTSVLRELIKELELTSRFVEVDSRDLQSGITPLLGHPNPDKKDIIMPCVFLLDEFQNTRTIDIHGNDTERADGLAELFSFLSDGKIVINRNQYKVEQVLFLLNRIKIDVDSVVQQIEDFYEQRATSSLSKPTVVGQKTSNDSSEKPERKQVSFETKMFYFYDYYIDNIEALVGADFLQIKYKSPQDALLALAEALKDYGPTKVFDLSKSLVFVAGNIDEAFAGLTSITDNDYFSPDDFYALSSKVNFNQVKQALFYRFKPEQVSRLGSNHVIFPSFNTAMYKALITSLNKRSISKYKDLGIKIKIDKSIDEFILKHNAIPSQGARSVLSAHEYLVDSNLSEIIAETMIRGGKEVLIGVVNNRVHLINDKKKVIKKNIDIIDLTVLKNYEDKRTNHTISVHEASHAVVSIALLGELPSTIKVRMNDSSIGGYCKIEGFPELANRRDYINFIAIALAGYVGELIDNNYNIDMVSVGSSSDIVKATGIATDLVKVLGLGISGDITARGVSGMVADVMLRENNKEVEEEIENIVNEGFLLAHLVLVTMQKEHRLLTEVLKKNVTIKPNQIKHIFYRS
jgi:cell division protease FtsH